MGAGRRDAVVEGRQGRGSFIRTSGQGRADNRIDGGCPLTEKCLATRLALSPIWQPRFRPCPTRSN